jgi:hypothetical protein
LHLRTQAVFTGAIVPCDQRDTVHLLKRLIVCLACASTDEQHPGVRYARLLIGLLRTFSRGTDYVESRAQTPTRLFRSAGQEVEGDQQDRSSRRLRRDLAPLEKRTDQVDAWPASATQSPREQCAQPPAELSVQPEPLSLLPVAQSQQRADPSSSQTDVYDFLSLSSGSIFDTNLMSYSQHQCVICYYHGPSDTIIDYSIDLNPPPAPEEFSHLLSDHEALDSDFWCSLSMQHGQWNLADLVWTPNGPS